MFLPSMRGKGRAWLALLCLFLSPLTFAQATPGPGQADVQLKTNINTMAVQIGQGAPLPPGGCNPGYLWHSSYGGCRIAQTQSETSQCPPGYSGSRVRYRTTYTLQANPADVAVEAWGVWQDSCQAPPPPATVKFEVIKAPDWLHCRWTEFRVRATYPDGTRAAGIELLWDTRGHGALELPVTRTDGNGESSNWVTRFDNMQMSATVSWGVSSIGMSGICVGGT